MDESQEMYEENNKRWLSIEMEFEKDIDLETCEGSILQITIELLNQWTKTKVIEGIYATDGQIINNKYENLDSWAIEPKIVSKKKYVLVETILQVKTRASAYVFYQSEKEYCDSNNIRVGWKNTCMEYTKKIGFIIGIYVKLASLKYYIEELSNNIKLEERLIDIKKRFTYERGTRSKVLTIYAVE